MDVANKIQQMATHGNYEIVTRTVNDDRRVADRNPQRAKMVQRNRQFSFRVIQTIVCLIVCFRYNNKSNETKNEKTDLNVKGICLRIKKSVLQLDSTLIRIFCESSIYRKLNIQYNHVVNIQMCPILFNLTPQNLNTSRKKKNEKATICT